MVEKQIIITYSTILKGKLYRFKKKSVLKYLIASCLLVLGLALLEMGFTEFILVDFIIILGVLFFISFSIMMISTKILAKAINFNANFKFSKEKITIIHLNKDLVEETEWPSSVDFEITNSSIILNFKQKLVPFHYFLIMEKDKLTEEEILFFQKQLEDINKN